MRPTKRPPTKSSIQNQQTVHSPFSQKEPTWSHPNSQPFQNSKPQPQPIQEQTTNTRMQSSSQVPEHKTSQRHSNISYPKAYRNTNK